MSEPESTGTIPLVDLAPEAPAEAEKSKPSPTTYTILKQVPATSPGNPGHWLVVASAVEAQGAAGAIRKSVTPTEEAQTFVAVPTRSFRPVTVTVETKTQMKLQ